MTISAEHQAFGFPAESVTLSEVVPPTAWLGSRPAILEVSADRFGHLDAPYEVRPDAWRGGRPMQSALRPSA